MDNRDIAKIIEFLDSHPTLESVNTAILQAENNILRRIKNVKDFAESESVTVTINDNQVVSSFIGNVLGVYHLPYGYNYERKAVTARVNNWSSLYYAVRESLWDFYSYLNAEVNKDLTQVKMAKIHLFNDEDTQNYLVKKFQNGKAVYWYESEMKERILLTRWIESYFQERINS